MSGISIKRIGITDLDTDAVVNAANTRLLEGSGVCGAIFRAAGSRQMTEACNKYGHCDEGDAVITPGFNLKAKYVIHTVGPRYSGGHNGEADKLYSAYQSSLRLAMENGCHSIGFPVISAGIFGYPHEQAWEIAIKSCRDFQSANPEYDIDIIFAVIDSEMHELGETVLGRS